LSHSGAIKVSLKKQTQLCNKFYKCGALFL